MVGRSTDGQSHTSERERFSKPFTMLSAGFTGLGLTPRYGSEGKLGKGAPETGGHRDVDVGSAARAGAWSRGGRMASTRTLMESGLPYSIPAPAEAGLCPRGPRSRVIPPPARAHTHTNTHTHTHTRTQLPSRIPRPCTRMEERQLARPPPHPIMMPPTCTVTDGASTHKRQHGTHW